MKDVNTNTFIKFSTLLFFYMSVISFVLYTNFITINSIHQVNAENAVLNNVEEYNEIDLQHLCAVISCAEIGVGPSNYTLTDGILKKTDNYFSNGLMDSNYNINIYEKKYNIHAKINTHILIKEVLFGYVRILGMFLIMFTFAYIIIEYKERRRKMLDMMSTSNSLREKNMQILTENIHHELNTPVAIIQGNIKQLEILMEDQINPCSSCAHNYYFDFGLIYSSIEQIDTVLQRMSNFKNLKYSNGNKTVMDIVSYSANSMSIYKASNFKIDLDVDFSNYKLKHGINNLKNGDLLNVISNHCRNSLEASATKIELQCKYNKITEKLHIFIVDNGTGLRDPLTGLALNPEKYGDIFKEYYTSKDDLGKSKVEESKGWFNDNLQNIRKTFNYKNKNENNKNARGVGLYLNKELLKENGGDLRLRETSSNGTVFEIIIPAKEVKEIKKLT